uniref:Uncharacterized protein n=1 Tax=Bartonella rochalimae ATCC BAA-1498 TaxID=685782 RepID=E6YLB4_9HYPH|nr:hypothetical protein BARRO_50015 [Bartonella rochalimae ATCC BAA-1498]
MYFNICWVVGAFDYFNHFSKPLITHIFVISILLKIHNSINIICLY